MGKAMQLLRGLWRVLGSTRLAAILLAAVLLVSLLASFLPQMPTSPATRDPWLAAVFQRYGRATNLLYRAGLFEAYRAPWFLILVATLLLNTMVCSLQRLPRLWRSLSRRPTIARPDAFYQGFTRRSECSIPSLNAGIRASERFLTRYRFHVYVELDQRTGHAYLYAERCRWAPTGTLLSHLAVLLLALTMLVQPILSWEQPGVILASGQEYPVGHGRDLVVRQGELEIVQHPDGALRNLQVSLVVEAGASPPVTRTVAINQPTTFRGISFHLQSYGPGARLSTPERTYPLAFASDQAQQVLLPQIGVTLRVAYQPEDRNLFVEALDPDGHVLGSGVVAEGTEIRVQGMPLKFTLSPYTVWQVGHDPTFGLAILWSGLMLAGIGLSLWCPHRRLWLRLDSQCLQMVGVGDFAGGFENIASELGRACQAETKDGVEPDAARVADG